METYKSVLNDRSPDSRLVVMVSADRKIDRRILLEADSLEAAGWRVVIIGMPLDPGDEDSDPRIVRVAGKGSRVSKESGVIIAYRWMRRRLPMNSQLMMGIKALAWRYLIDQEIFYKRLFLRTVSRYHPRVLVAHDLPMLPVAREASQACGAKLVYDSHELYCEQELSRLEKRRWAEIEAKYIRSCDAVITVNRSIARELEIRYGISDVKVIYNAERCDGEPVNRRFFNRQFGFSTEKKVILFQGGLHTGRNLEVLVSAMGLVRNPLVSLILMGDGRLRKSLEKMVKKLALSDRVHFHDAVRQEELLSFSACADAGVIPYQATCLNNYYCTPNKLFEYIAAGVPVIASNLPEIRNIVTSHCIGLVGDLGSPDSAARHIEEFFSDQKAEEKWRQKIMEARQVLSWNKEMEKIVSIYSAFR